MGVLTAGDYVSDVDPMTYLTVLSKEEAYRRWDSYGSIGKYKNKLFKPLIFPDPAIYLNNARPLSDYLKNRYEKDGFHVKDTTGINIGAEGEWIKIE